MLDSNWETFRIDLPFEFTAWNKEVVRNNMSVKSEVSWANVVGSLKDMIEEKSKED